MFKIFVKYIESNSIIKHVDSCEIKDISLSLTSRFLFHYIIFPSQHLYRSVLPPSQLEGQLWKSRVGAGRFRKEIACAVGAIAWRMLIVGTTTQPVWSIEPKLRFRFLSGDTAQCTLRSSGRSLLRERELLSDDSYFHFSFSRTILPVPIAPQILAS